MSYRITFTDKYTGEERTHTCTNSESDGVAWAKSLAEDNNCKAVCEHVADGPYDNSGTVTHIASFGDEGDE